jgi:hypothetical protein
MTHHLVTSNIKSTKKKQVKVQLHVTVILVYTAAHLSITLTRVKGVVTYGCSG